MKIKFSTEDRIFNIHTDEIPYLSFEMFDEMGVPNLYSTRFKSFDEETGVGEAGLRLAYMRGEDRDEAAPITKESRDKLAHQLGSSIEMEFITDQKHTANVLMASKDELGFLEEPVKPLHRQRIDGVITDIPDVLLTAFGADCPPVYIVDPVRKAVGLVHAGWRGTLGKIPEVAIKKMIENFGSKPEDMYAAVGPGICKDCYEMGDEVYDLFAEQWSEDDAKKLLSRYPAVDADGQIIPEGKYHLDLREANKLTLLRSGIPADHIAVSNVCTKCNADTFYSYRAKRMENEQVAMLVNRFDK